MIDLAPIRARFAAVLSELDERERRLLAAAEARAAGYGGIAAVSAATGMAASTIGRGLAELSEATALAPGRVRRPGGGCKPRTETDPTLLADLLTLVEPDERGDPMSPLRWTCKSLRHLAAALTRCGHRVSHTVVGALLKAEKFSLQANRKTREGGLHPDRDAQSPISTRASPPRWPRSSRSSRWTRRRKSWLGSSRTPAAHGARRASRKRSGCMTS